MNRLEYVLSTQAPKTKEELYWQLEFHFHAYLKGLTASWEEKDFLKSLVKSKGWFLALLWDIHGREIFKNTQYPLSLDTLRNILENLSEIGKTVYENMTQEDLSNWIYEWEIAVVIWWKHYFKNNEVTFQDMMRLETFFRGYLVNKFIILTQESENKLDIQHHAYLISNLIRSELFLFAAKIEHIQKIKIGWEITHILSILLQQANNISYHKWERFLEQIKLININEITLENAQKLLWLLTETLCEIPVTQETTKTKVRNIVLWDCNKKTPESFEFRLILKDNFYFRKEEEVVWENDIFPDNGSLFYDAHTLQNVCIFQPNGNKVYWGDLRVVDYQKLQGTYYVLDEQTGWKKVPRYAKGNITSLVEVQDPYIQEVKDQNPSLAREFIPKDITFLTPEYIRTFASWKIQKWEYIHNPQNTDY